MWLEQTVWIWGPIACAASLWIISRLAAIRREMHSLRMHVSELEDANGLSAEPGNRSRHAA